MREPLPFEDDRRADALAAFDGLVRALARMEARGEIVRTDGLEDFELDEVRFRLIDLMTAALDAAGISEGLDRIAAFNVMAETLEDGLADIIEEELGEGDDEDEGLDAVLAPYELARDAVVAAVKAKPLRLPSLVVTHSVDQDHRN